MFMPLICEFPWPLPICRAIRGHCLCPSPSAKYSHREITGQQQHATQKQEKNSPPPRLGSGSFSLGQWSPLTSSIHPPVSATNLQSLPQEAQSSTHPTPTTTPTALLHHLNRALVLLVCLTTQFHKDHLISHIQSQHPGSYSHVPSPVSLHILTISTPLKVTILLLHHNQISPSTTPNTARTSEPRRFIRERTTTFVTMVSRSSSSAVVTSSLAPLNVSNF